jgi:ATP-dependent DNA helicase RecQ
VPENEPDLSRLLREQFGHRQFLPGQERIVRDLLAGRDVLAVLPTGGGKSLVYQMAAQLLPGVTVVVSPLIALMKDQVESLAEAGVEASLLNSALSASESAEELEDVRRGESRLLYVTPEQLAQPGFLNKLGRQRVALLVVDEAHVIGEWGHTFRPAYLELGDVARRLGRPTLLALTATATTWLRQEIAERLGLHDPDIVVHGTDRANLFLEVCRVESAIAEHRLLRRLLGGETVLPNVAETVPSWLADDLPGAQSPEPVTIAPPFEGSGIVYVATTRAARETASWLRSWGIAADYYHGQRRRADRARVQEAFMAGDLRIIAATNAFGLGIDKPDVRFVIHRDVPASLEAYYQEAGRAGRDGGPARCTLIYRPAVLGRAAFLSGAGQSDESTPEDKASRQAYLRSRLDMMRAYAELPDCRRGFLLNYFGEVYDRARCGACDNDLVELQGSRAKTQQPVGTGDRADLAVNSRVAHAGWGDGTVQYIARDSVTVLFDRVGYKTFDMALVQERDLLEPIESSTLDVEAV